MALSSLLPGLKQPNMAEGGGTGMHLLYFANSTDVTSYESRDKQLEYTTLFPLLKKLLPPDLAE